MELDLWKFEKKAYKNGFIMVAGLDESGRGPLAGPVVSAAVILPASFIISDINDSKKLTPNKRKQLYEKIFECATSIGIGIIDPAEIDRVNILQASLFSMKMSVDNLRPKPDYLLIDGKFKIPSDVRQEPIVKGDSLSISIAAASIIAKETRDRLMERYDLDHPQYGFAKHKGYPTNAHREAIKKYGCCSIHRWSFKGVKEHAK